MTVLVASGDFRDQNGYGSVHGMVESVYLWHVIDIMALKGKCEVQEGKDV